MIRHIIGYELLICLAVLVAGCGNGQKDELIQPVFKPDTQAGLAIEDLAGRLAILPGGIEIISNKNVTWRDGSLGCPKEGMMYTQALVDGTLIVLRVGDTDYEYHSGKGRPPFYCENPAEPLPKSSSE